jgi:hypothetical protein
LWSPCCRRRFIGQEHAVCKPGDHKGRPYSGQCECPYLFSRLTVISETSAPGVTIDTD